MSNYLFNLNNLYILINFLKNNQLYMYKDKIKFSELLGKTLK